jgi:hypothetical protein
VIGEKGDGSVENGGGSGAVWLKVNVVGDPGRLGTVDGDFMGLVLTDSCPFGGDPFLWTVASALLF